MRKPFKRVLLHIGPGKSGTTSIQQFLFSNHAALWARGLYVPSSRSLGVKHIELSLLFGPRREALKRLTGAASGSLDARREEIANAFAAEIASVGGGDTLLISSEHLFDADLSAIEAYRRFFAPYAERFESLMYLRRQDRWIVSQVLQARQTGSSTDIRLGPRSPALYEQKVRLWDAGGDQCNIRRFDAEFLVRGSLLEDFREAIGCGGMSFGAQKVFNSAVLQEQLELVDAVNGVLASIPFDKQLARRSRFLSLCAEVLGGSPFEFPRASAQAVFEAYAPVNIWLRETRDPDGPTFFFNDDFTAYPIEACNDRAYTIEQLLELSAVIAERLGEGAQDITKRPDGAERAALVAHIISSFITLYDSEVEHERAARRTAAIEERRRARLNNQTAAGAPAPYRPISRL